MSLPRPSTHRLHPHGRAWRTAPGDRLSLWLEHRHHRQNGASVWAYWTVRSGRCGGASRRSRVGSGTQESPTAPRVCEEKGRLVQSLALTNNSSSDRTHDGERMAARKRGNASNAKWRPGLWKSCQRSDSSAGCHSPQGDEPTLRVDLTGRIDPAFPAKGGTKLGTVERPQNRSAMYLVEKIGSSGWIRTSNPPVNSRMLCR